MLPIYLPLSCPPACLPAFPDATSMDGAPRQRKTTCQYSPGLILAQLYESASMNISSLPKLSILRSGSLLDCLPGCSGVCRP